MTDEALTPDDVRRAAEAIKSNVAKAVFGLEDAVRLLLVALLSDGHVLLEEVPGTGKTTLARAVARSLGLEFARIQCTPDLLPSDVTGLYWFNQRDSDFEFRPGPIFANLVLADEINRATPRTQSALLEGMAERQVTVEGTTHLLPSPFLVVATQNPVELEGTFPLPEAQLDRFLVRIKLGYPSEAAEHDILRRHAIEGALDSLQQLDLPPIPELQSALDAVAVSDDVRAYIVGLCRATREHPALEIGVSPRGTLFLYRAARAMAALQGRDYVMPDDVKAVAGPVLGHRVIVEAGLELRGGMGHEVIRDIVDGYPVPVE